MADIKLPKIALGAWAWGNDGTFGSGIDAAELKPIFDAAMAAGLNLWDTAYAYGMGTSEKVLAGFLALAERGDPGLLGVDGRRMQGGARCAAEHALRERDE